MALCIAKPVKVKRGYYHTNFERITPDGKQFEPLEVVDKFLKNLKNNY